MKEGFMTKLLATLCTVASIHAHAQGQTDYSKVEIKTTKISANFYTLEGQGGTVGVLPGPDGVFVVDSQFAPLTGKLVAAIKAISNQPIKFLVDTHVHGDHTGGNANFANLGAIIFARDQLRARLQHPAPAANGTPGTPAPAAALPVITYDGPVTLHINGEEVRLIPIRRAHTDGDTLVYFPNADVIMSGDFYRSVQYPNIDRANGGSLNGMVDGLGELIGLAGPNTKIVPGHGPIVDRTAVIAHRDALLAIRDRISKLIDQGKTLEEITAAKPTADFDGKTAQGPQTTDRLIVAVYAELKATK
jgi:cyclase